MVCPIPEPQGPGLPEGIADSLIILPWNDADLLKKVIEENYKEIAAVISEPIMCNTGCILPKPGYLEAMRELTEKYGIVLIIDEVITGFRISLAGAQGHYGIKPDLSIFAKGMGGGFPVAAMGGKAEIMQLVDEGKVSVAGTYSGNGIALSAASATLDYLRQPGLYEGLYRRCDKLREGLDEIWKKSKNPSACSRSGTGIPGLVLRKTDLQLPRRKSLCRRGSVYPVVGRNAVPRSTVPSALL